MTFCVKHKARPAWNEDGYLKPQVNKPGRCAESVILIILIVDETGNLVIGCIKMATYIVCFSLELRDYDTTRTFPTLIRERRKENSKECFLLIHGLHQWEVRIFHKSKRAKIFSKRHNQTTMHEIWHLWRRYDSQKHITSDQEWFSIESQAKVLIFSSFGYDRILIFCIVILREISTISAVEPAFLLFTPCKTLKTNLVNHKNRYLISKIVKMSEKMLILTIILVSWKSSSQTH